ncbi:MAG: hypothetical protein ACRC8S_10585 [Fimbriiglobus sp.]
MRGWLGLLAWIVTGTVFAQTPSGSPPTATEALSEAVKLFQQGSNQPKKYGDAAKYFSAAFHKVEMTQEQLAAWAYCRVRLANEDLARAPQDVRVASRVLVEVEEALALAPSYDKLQKVGADVIRQAKLAGAQAPATPGQNFEFRGVPSERLRRSIEGVRDAIFTRWTGKPGAAWSPRCEVVLHETAESFTQATKQAPSTRGHATTELTEGRVTKRRLDLCLAGDPATLEADILPRELTHVILADLFPTKPPPTWAAIGMAHLATSADEQTRYRNLLAPYKASLIPLETFFTNPTAADAALYHLQSAAFVNYLVRSRGERELVQALNLVGRYGAEGGLRNAYGLQSLNQLETQWKRASP